MSNSKTDTNLDLNMSSSDTAVELVRDSEKKEPEDSVRESGRDSEVDIHFDSQESDACSDNEETMYGLVDLDLDTEVQDIIGYDYVAKCENDILRLVFTTNGITALEEDIRMRFPYFEEIVSLNYFTGSYAEVETDVLSDDTRKVYIITSKEKLTSQSQYFRALLHSGMLAGQYCTLPLKDLDVVEFLHLGSHLWLDGVTVASCCACGRIAEFSFAVYKENTAICRLLRLAMRFGCNSLIEEIIWLNGLPTIEDISKENCLSILCLIDTQFGQYRNLPYFQYQYEKSLRYARFYIEQLFSQIKDFLENPEFHRSLQFLLKNKMLNINRKQSLSELSRLVSSHFVEFELASSQPLIYVTVTFNCETYDDGSNSVVLKDSRGTLSAIGEVLHSTQVITKESKVQLLDVPGKLVGEAYASTGKDLYVVGGQFGEGIWNHKIYHFDVLEREWTVQQEKMVLSIRDAVMCCSAKCLYILGGNASSAIYRFLTTSYEMVYLPDLPGDFTVKAAVVNSADSVLVVCSSYYHDGLYLELPEMEDSTIYMIWRPIRSAAHHSTLPLSEWYELLYQLEGECEKEENEVRILWFPEFETKEIKPGEEQEVELN